MKSIALAALAVVLAACNSAAPSATATLTSPPTPSPAATPAPTQTPVPSAASHVLTGLVSVDGFEFPALGKCTPTAGFEDVNIGTNVVVKDGAGTIIGSGDLSLSPRAEPSDFTFYDDGSGGFPCRFTYTITVPEADFYHISVGRRDGPVNSAAQLVALGWVWDLALGSSS